MESSILSHQILCNIHPKEAIKRVCQDLSCEQSIFCIECILNQKDDDKHEQFVQLEEFLNTAVKFYESNFKNLELGQEAPPHLFEVLSKESERLEQLSKHLEKQKSEVDYAIQELIKKFTQACLKKRDELWDKLDKELITFKYNYHYFEKQLKKQFANTRDEDVFPTKEALTNKMNNITTGVQLFTLVKDIKTDLLDHEKEKEQGKKTGESLLIHLESLAKALNNEGFSLPTFIDSSSIGSFKADSILKTPVEKIFDEIFEYENAVNDLSVSFGLSLPGSKIVKKQSDISLLKKWINPKKDSNFKLLYSGSKDGFTPADFHKKCDKKRNTLVIIQTTDNKAVFGGFIDKPWDQSGAYMVTDKAWLFSLTQKKKYKIKEGMSQYAGYGNASYGPCFGGGNDFYTSGDFRTTQGSCNPHSFDFTDSKKLCGGPSFTVKEIEVYQVIVSTFASSVEKPLEIKEKKPTLPSSSILSKDQINKIIETIDDEVSLEKHYQATKDGFSAQSFHDKLDGQQDFVIVIKGTGEQIFGGYTKTKCSSTEECKEDTSAFLFRFGDNNDDIDSDDEIGIQNKEELKKYPVSDPLSAVYYAPGHLIHFGNSDLIIGSNAHNIQNSSSYLGEIYEIGDGANLCGSVNEFKVNEIEVFLVKQPKDQ